MKLTKVGEPDKAVYIRANGLVTTKHIGRTKVCSNNGQGLASGELLPELRAKIIWYGVRDNEKETSEK